jgi:predicted nucleic acid-binding protein
VIVLDASAAIELLLNTELGERVGERLAGTQEALHAPHLIDVEVLHVLRRLCAQGVIGERRTREALADLAELPLTRHSHEDLVGRAWTIRSALTAYDAMYIVLAEALDATVVTCDERLGRAHGHTARVDVTGRVG